MVTELAPLSAGSPEAEVTGALLPALGRLGVQVTAILPRRADGSAMAGLARRLEPLGGVRIHEGALPAGGVHVIVADEVAPGDDAGLCAAAARIASALPHPPDIVHAHGWRAVPGLRAIRAPGVLSLYGVAGAVALEPERAIELGAVAADEPVPLPALGVAIASRTVVASPRYARALADGDDELADAVSAAGERVVGIRRGVDYAAFDPARDPRLPAAFSAADRAGKGDVKTAAQHVLGLPRRAHVPLIVAPAPVADTVIAAIAALGDAAVQVAVLGPLPPGDAAELRQLAHRHPTRIAAPAELTADQRHVAAAGADFHLLSQFDPCGPSQLWGMRYGAVPIAAADTELADDLVDFDPDTATGSGVIAETSAPDDLAAAMRRAARAHGSSRFGRLVARAMATDLSWATAARRHRELYENLLPGG